VTRKPDGPRNLAASVRARLLAIAHAAGDEFQSVLVRYATERLLYRIGRSTVADQLVLKGAWLFYVWGISRRATRDADFLGLGPSSPGELTNLFNDVLSVEVEDDGLDFGLGSITVQEIRLEALQPGARVRLVASLATARISVQLDIAFGDAIVGNAPLVRLPTLLDFPAPELRAYEIEAVIAEKTEAIVRFGAANTRYKDFFDLFVLAGEKDIRGERLRKQMKLTFDARGTALPTYTPDGLTPEFAGDPERQRQWLAFLRRSSAEQEPAEFDLVVNRVRELVWPPLQTAASDSSFDPMWIADIGWVATN
jgi:predicted nucleotidyltransferase component of viral defense system